jgi:3'-phosphoadenosine 5'-phosphosulfate sulfotransferase (PAPS reductase)/FAD synthetase
MGQYGKTAVRAAQYIQTGMRAESAWKKAAEEIISSQSSRVKGCPKGAFLGLFSSDHGINASYAKHALEILRANPTKHFTADELWYAIGNYKKAHNQQMDVVLSLWNSRLIK